MTPNPKDQQRDEENPDDRPQPPQRMNSEERSNDDERHCLHFYENDQHYAHEGPHEIASWREVVSLRSALAAALARIAAVEAENEQLARGLADLHADAVKQIKGTADDMAAAGERMLKSFRAEMQSRVIDPLFAERDALAACRAAVEALCDEAEDPNRWPPRGVTFDGASFPAVVSVAAVRAVLAASPTPTGPEPAKYEYCPHGWTRAHCGSCHDEVYGPATPEPTEETP